MKKIAIITLILILMIPCFAFAKDKMFLAHQAMDELCIDKMEIVSVRIIYLGEFDCTLYIIAKNPEGGLVSLVIRRDKTVLWGRNPWRLLRADKIR